MPAVGRRMAPAPHLGRDKAPFAGAVRGRPWKADGVPDRATGPDDVRYTSVDTATPRRTVTHSDTRRDKNENSPADAFPQPGGRFRRWWQVLGSNQRRLSRRFYRPLSPAESKMPLTSTNALRGVMSGRPRPRVLGHGALIRATDRNAPGHGRRIRNGYADRTLHCAAGLVATWPLGSTAARCHHRCGRVQAGSGAWFGCRCSPWRALVGNPWQVGHGPLLDVILVENMVASASSGTVMWILAPSFPAPSWPTWRGSPTLTDPRRSEHAEPKGQKPWDKSTQHACQDTPEEDVAILLSLFDVVDDRARCRDVAVRNPGQRAARVRLRAHVLQIVGGLKILVLDLIDEAWRVQVRMASHHGCERIHQFAWKRSGADCRECECTLRAVLGRVASDGQDIDVCTGIAFRVGRQVTLNDVDRFLARS